MVKVLITGGTGLIGQKLTKLLEDKGHKVVILSRNPSKENQFRWDISKQYIDKDALIGTTHIIHLAGAGIADKRWTINRKKELINSRVDSANLLFQKIKEYQVPLHGFISASGIGYYGAITSKTIFTEEYSPHNDFIAEICIKWEAAAKQFKKLDIPITIFRTGVVLAKNDSALQKINTPLMLASLGKGSQYLPWIHIDDLCNLYLKAIVNENFNGIYNAVAPEHQTNKSFTKLLGDVLKKNVAPLNVPSIALKLALGEMSKILLEGSRVSAEKTQNKYTFIYNNLQSALQNIYGR